MLATSLADIGARDLSFLSCLNKLYLLNTFLRDSSTLIYLCRLVHILPPETQS